MILESNLPVRRAYNVDGGGVDASPAQMPPYISSNAGLSLMRQLAHSCDRLLKNLTS